MLTFRELKTVALFSCCLTASLLSSACMVMRDAPRPIVVQGAMDVEIQKLAGMLEHPVRDEVGGWTFWRGTIDGYPVVISKSLKGMENAAAATYIFALGALTDLRHRAHHECRIVTDGRFSREHHSVGAVEHGVGNVADLCSRWCRRLDHAFEHLRCRDNGQAGFHALSDNPLLKMRHFRQRTVDPEVATGDHNGVTFQHDLVERHDCVRRLDLGYQLGHPTS